MKIATILKESDILILPSVEDKLTLFSILLEHILTQGQRNKVIDDTVTLADLLNPIAVSNNYSSVALGEGVAFPHARIDFIDSPLIAMAVLKKGLDVETPDGKPLTIIFLSLFPSKRFEIGLKIQSVLARFLLEQDGINKIITASNSSQIFDAIEKAELAITTPIIAQDFMVIPKVVLYKDTLFQEAMELMHQSRVESAPVVNTLGEVIGEVTCVNLFQKYLPDYIKELNSVPPIHDFNPFTNYFTTEKTLTVADILDENIAIVEQDASLIEIVFLLSVQKYSVVHVCRDNKLIGSIDSITIRDKVFIL